MIIGHKVNRFGLCTVRTNLYIYIYFKLKGIRIGQYVDTYIIINNIQIKKVTGYICINTDL